MLLIPTLLALSSPSMAADADAGKSLYAANCMACHGESGDGNGPAAIALSPPPKSFSDPTFWTDRTDAKLSTSIKAGKPGTAMAGFGQLSDTDVANLIAYMKSFKPTE